MSNTLTAPQKPKKTYKTDAKPIYVSKLLPNHVTLPAGGTPTLVCPACGAWTIVKRTVLRPHRNPDTSALCTDSRRPVTIDLTTEEHHQRLLDAMAATAHRRPTIVTPAPPKPLPAPAVTQMTPGRDQRTPYAGPRWYQWAVTDQRVRDADDRRAQIPGPVAQSHGAAVPTVPTRITRTVA